MNYIYIAYRTVIAYFTFWFKMPCGICKIRCAEVLDEYDHGRIAVCAKCHWSSTLLSFDTFLQNGGSIWPCGTYECGGCAACEEEYEKEREMEEKEPGCGDCGRCSDCEDKAFKKWEDGQ